MRLNSGFWLLAAVSLLAVQACRTAPCQALQQGLCAAVTPPAGGGTHQSLHITLHDPRGVAELRFTRILISGTLDGAHACYIYYDRPRNAFLLVDDAGLQSTPLAVGATSTVANSQCRLDGAGSSASSAGNEQTLRLNLTFHPDFYGEKQIFLATDTIDRKSTDLQSTASWTVP